MIKNRSVLAKLAVAGVTLALVAGAGVAQARDVYWSVGVNSPGIAVGVANGFPMYAAPAPVYYAPPPVYMPPPRPVYYAPARPVYYAPPVYMGAPPAYYYRDGGRRHHRHDRDGDRGRWDNRRDWDNRYPG